MPDEAAAVQRITTAGERETAALGAKLGETVGPGTVILLYGDLGSGKTAFIRGLAQGLGVDPDEVSSPTFTLVQQYAGRLTLFHVDLYRLVSGEVDELGLAELGAEGVTAIEWADRLPRPIEGAIEVWIEDRGEDVREVVIRRDSSALPS